MPDLEPTEVKVKPVTVNADFIIKYPTMCPPIFYEGEGEEVEPIDQSGLGCFPGSELVLQSDPKDEYLKSVNSFCMRFGGIKYDVANQIAKNIDSDDMAADDILTLTRVEGYCSAVERGEKEGGVRRLLEKVSFWLVVATMGIGAVYGLVTRANQVITLLLKTFVGGGQLLAGLGRVGAVVLRAILYAAAGPGYLLTRWPTKLRVGAGNFFRWCDTNFKNWETGLKRWSHNIAQNIEDASAPYDPAKDPKAKKPEEAKGPDDPPDKPPATTGDSGSEGVADVEDTAEVPIDVTEFSIVDELVWSGVTVFEPAGQSLMPVFVPNPLGVTLAPGPSTSPVTTPITPKIPIEVVTPVRSAKPTAAPNPIEMGPPVPITVIRQNAYAALKYWMNNSMAKDFLASRSMQRAFSREMARLPGLISYHLGVPITKVKADLALMFRELNVRNDTTLRFDQALTYWFVSRYVYQYMNGYLPVTEGAAYGRLPSMSSLLAKQYTIARPQVQRAERYLISRGVISKALIADFSPAIMRGMDGRFSRANTPIMIPPLICATGWGGVLVSGLQGVSALISEAAAAARAKGATEAAGELIPILVPH